MTKIRINGKFVTTTLALKRDRRRARKSEARQTSGRVPLQKHALFGDSPTNIRSHKRDIKKQPAGTPSTTTPSNRAVGCRFVSSATTAAL